MSITRVLITLALTMALAPAAASAAGSIAYVDGQEIWVASFDGAQKAQLSAGEGDWRDVTAADSGHILGIRLEAGKIAQLSKIQLWGPDGSVLSQGPLPYTNRAWSSYAAPVGLDLSSDGVFLAYGYSGYTGVVPNASFYRGHNVVNADTKTLIQPIGQEGYEWPSMFGRRVVAAQGSLVRAQPDDGSGPFGTTWNTLLDAGPSGLDLATTDVAASGNLLAVDFQQDAPEVDKVGVISTQGINSPVVFPAAVDCFVPAVGNASDATLSQDGTRIAWKDDEGVKVAGVPTTAADPCVLSSPPIVISPTGSYPSIGGADISALRPPAPGTPSAPVPTAPGTGSPAPTGQTPAARLVVTVPARISVARLAARRGVPVQVTVPRAGRVTLRGSVPAKQLRLKGKAQIVVATGIANPKAAGKVSVKLRLNARGRKAVKRLRGARLALRIVQGSLVVQKTVRLR